MKFGVGAGRGSLRTVPASTELARQGFSSRWPSARVLNVRHPLASAGPTWRQVNPLNVTKCVPFSPSGRRSYDATLRPSPRRYSIHAPILRVAISQLFFMYIQTRLTPRAGSWLFGPSCFNSLHLMLEWSKKKGRNESDV
jgi:hypothetical protein